MSSDSVFEIREYLDGSGKVSGHDVLDISKELEFMAKLCGDMEQSSQGDANEDERFIRELALIADGKDGSDVVDADDDFLSAFDEPEPAKATGTSNQAKSTGSVMNQKKSGTATGWKKGFFSQSSSTANKTKTIAVAANSNSESSVVDKGDGAAIGGTAGQPDKQTHSTAGVGPQQSTGTSATETSSTNPSAPSSSSSSAPTVSFALPDKGASEAREPQQPQAQAFSGSILERAPAPLPLSTGRLGPGARIGGKHN